MENPGFLNVSFSLIRKSNLEKLLNLGKFVEFITYYGVETKSIS